MKFFFFEIIEMKKMLLPDGMDINEMECEVPLKNLLEKMTSRLLDYVKNISEYSTLIFKFKCGFDGTSATHYKQNYESNTESSEESIFMSCVVPLQLINDVTQEVLWKNPRPSATQFCCPSHIQFIKESAEVCKKKEANIEIQIKIYKFYHCWDHKSEI